MLGKLAIIAPNLYTNYFGEGAFEEKTGMIQILSGLQWDGMFTKDTPLSLSRFNWLSLIRKQSKTPDRSPVDLTQGQQIH